MPSEGFVDGGDAVDRRADGFLDGDPGAFLAGSGRAGPAAESGGAGELGQQGVAFTADGVLPSEVRPFVCFAELLIKVTQPLSVGVEDLLVEGVAEPGLGDDTGAGSGEAECADGLAGTAEQLTQVAEAAQGGEGYRCAAGSDEPEPPRGRMQMDLVRTTSG
ncbi:MAG: hypothetical protein ABJB47_19100 [Actinomycetota bacterium]